MSDPIMAKLGTRTVSKGTVLRRMDGLSRDRRIMAKALADLEKGEAGLADLGVNNGYVESTPEEHDHIRDHWLRDPADAQALRNGLILAAKRALKLNLPVDSYWVCAGSRLEVAVCESDRQITMLIIAPFPSVLEATGDALPDPEIEIVR